MQLARRASLVVVLLVLALVGTASAQAQQEAGFWVTVEDYMRMDRHGQMMYMTGLIEGHRFAMITARMAIASGQGHPDGEVKSELRACRWDSHLSIKASVEAVLYRVPREEWAVKSVAGESAIPLSERLNAGCPWGKK